MRRTTLVPLALCLALLMVTSSTVTAGGDVTMTQAAPNAEQPTAETIHSTYLEGQMQNRVGVISIILMLIIPIQDMVKKKDLVVA